MNNAEVESARLQSILPFRHERLRALEFHICGWGDAREDYYLRQVEADRLFPNAEATFKTDMIEMSWLSVGIPLGCLFDIIQMVDFVRKLGINLEDAEARICNENWRDNTTCKTCLFTLWLKMVREFDHNGSPDGNILPYAFIHTDVLRVSHADEKCGNKH